MTKEEFYSQLDCWGRTGNYGEVMSLDIGFSNSVENWQNDAKEYGCSFEKYLKQWYDEYGYELTFSWQKLGSGYGFNGTTILKYKNVVFKDIYGQLMIDVHFDER